jgi:hypothetical protein
VGGGCGLLLLLSLGGMRHGASQLGTCASCHVEQARAWAGSRHAVAADNPTFRESFRRSGHAWCLSCHGEPVGCLSCHGGEGTLQSARPSLLARAVHPMRPEPALADERLCARCHQFALPVPGELEAVGLAALPQHFDALAAQDTVEEWRQSAAARRGVSCAGCHEPHTAPGAHSPELVRGAVSVQARYDGQRAYFTLTAQDAAHAVPTGDPFRRLRLIVCPPERCEVPMATALLQRNLQREAGSWIVVRDGRIPPAATGDDARLELVLPLTGPLPPGARWRLFYHFADPRHEEALPREEVRFLVAEGQLVAGDQEPL